MVDISRIDNLSAHLAFIVLASKWMLDALDAQSGVSIFINALGAVIAVIWAIIFLHKVIS